MPRKKANRKKKENIVDEVKTVDEDKLFDSIVKDIKKDFAEGTQTHIETATNFLTSGNLGINYAISGRPDGGFPEGLVTEIYGDHSTGKSLIAYHALVQTQQRGGYAILIDTERAFNQHWFQTIGGDNSKLIYFETSTMEKVFDYITKLAGTDGSKTEYGIIRKKLPMDVPVTIVWDSLAQTSTEAELDKDMSGSEMAIRARKAGQGMRKVLGPLKRSNITFLVINQIRATMAMYGPDSDTVGGKAVKYASSVRVECRKGKVIKDAQKKEIGIGGKAKITKNRLRSPFAVSEFNIYWKEGIDPLSGYFTVCAEEGLIASPSRGWWEYNGKKFRESEFPEVLKANQELLGDFEIDQSKFDLHASSQEYEGVDDNVTLEEDEESLEDILSEN